MVTYMRFQSLLKEINHLRTGTDRKASGHTGKTMTVSRFHALTDPICKQLQPWPYFTKEARYLNAKILNAKIPLNTVILILKPSQLQRFSNHPP